MTDLIRLIEEKLKQSLTPDENGVIWAMGCPPFFGYRETLLALKVCIEALKDPENHWHSPSDYDFESKSCTACEALAEVRRIVGSNA